MNPDDVFSTNFEWLVKFDFFSQCSFCRVIATYKMFFVYVPYGSNFKDVAW